MASISRREAIRLAAASIFSAAVVGGVARASGAHSLGYGACTKCNCELYRERANETCGRCGHHYNAHRRLHS